MIPHPMAGYTYLGMHLLKLDTASTSSSIFYLYKKDADGALYRGFSGKVPWEVELEKVDHDLEDFVPFRDEC